MMTVLPFFFLFFLSPTGCVGHHFGSQNTQQIVAHTSTLLRGLTMVHTCVVAGCRNRRTPGTTLSFYRFPRDPERKQRWIAAVNREGWVPNDGSRLCSTHFISGMNAVQLTTAKSTTVSFLAVSISVAGIIQRDKSLESCSAFSLVSLFVV